MSAEEICTRVCREKKVIPFAARFHVSETTAEKEDQVIAIARSAESEVLWVQRTDLSDEQGYLGGTFIDFVPRYGGMNDSEVAVAMCGIYDDTVLLEALNSVEGVSVAPVDRPF